MVNVYVILCHIFTFTFKFLTHSPSQNRNVWVNIAQSPNLIAGIFATPLAAVIIIIIICIYTFLFFHNVTAVTWEALLQLDCGILVVCAVWGLSRERQYVHEGREVHGGYVSLHTWYQTGPSQCLSLQQSVTSVSSHAAVLPCTWRCQNHDSAEAKLGQGLSQVYLQFRRL